MALSQIQLEAFIEVSRAGSFSKAAGALNLTQSALSHRIRNLEEQLQTALFLRRGTGVTLTEAGTKLLKFCRIQTQAEEEFVHEFLPKKERSSKLAGTVRIGGASTLVRSVVLPALGDLLRNNPEVRLHLYTRELNELPGLLHKGQIDFLVTCGTASIPGTTESLLGHEENVLVESGRRNAITQVFLDHDMDDQTTLNFLKANGKKSFNLTRSFLDDIYGILDGVSLGLGQAVAPRHLISNRKDLRVVESSKTYKTPVFLYHMEQPYYTKLHEAVVSTLVENIPALLG